VGVQEARWSKGGKVRAGELYFFVWKRKLKSIGMRFFFLVHHRTVSAVARVDLFYFFRQDGPVVFFFSLYSGVC
jgi:hypothetical protein